MEIDAQELQTSATGKKRNRPEDSDSDSRSSVEFLEADENNSALTQQFHNYIDSIVDNENDKDVIKMCKNPTLQEALILNVKKRSTLLAMATNLERYLASLNAQEMKKKVRVPKQRKRMAKKRLRAPYFKDKDLFPCPANEDVHRMNISKELIFTEYFCLRTWTPSDKVSLAKGVYTDVCEREFKVVANRIRSVKQTNDGTYENSRMLELLQHEKLVFSNTNIIENLAENWHLIRSKSNEFDLDDPSGEVRKDRDRFQELQLLLKAISAASSDNIDWFKISVQYFSNRHNDTACKAMWTCYMHPEINKEPWTRTQDIALMEIVKKNRFQNWDKIAKELNVGKSPYQCCIHFHSKLCNKFKKDRWSLEEDEKLQKAIEICRIGDYIPWSKIAYYFRYRTKQQIYSHYKICLLPTHKGYFTVSEDVLLLTLTELFGKKFIKFKPYFPNRNMQQLRDHYKFLNTDNTREWTLKEDFQIIEYVEKHGDKSWSKTGIARTADCIRHRYHTIRKWFEANPTTRLEDLPRRRKNFYKNRSNNRSNLVHSTVAKLLAEIRANNNEANVLNTKYIESLLPVADRKKFRKTYVPKKRTDTTLESTLINFFASVHKSVARTKIVITDETINQTSNRIEMLLQIFGANLNLPSLEEIYNHPLLDKLDQEILTQIVVNREKSNRHAQNSNISQGGGILSITQESGVKFPNMQTYLLPPCPESLIGFRSLLLRSKTLLSHARREYENYRLFVPTYTATNHTGIRFAQRSIEIDLNRLDEETRQKVIKEQKLFWQRLRMIFSWPCMLSLQNNVPVQQKKIVELTEEPCGSGVSSTAVANSTESRVQGRKGRPKKDLKKIKLMNKARSKKQNKEIICQESND